MADRTVKVNIKGNISDFNRALLKGAAGAKAFTRELDSSSDRMSNLVQTSLALGPALVPVGAGAITAMSGLTSQLAFATAGAGAAILAFSGIGDALTAVNDYSLEPTTANLAKMQEAMAKLAPEGREFVRFLQDIRPELKGLRDAAQAGLFPGLQDGIEQLMKRLPEVEGIIGELTGAMGDLASEAGTNLAGPEWTEFFAFLEREARPAVIDLGRSLGNLSKGFAELWMAFDPISDQFSKGFLDASRSFAKWAEQLDQTEGFQSFLEYVQRVGPKAWDTLGAVGSALVALVEAAAPVGEVALPAIEAVADAIAGIARSDIGPAIVGIVALTSAMGRLVAIGRAAQGGAIGSLFGKTALGAGAASAVRAAKDLPAATRSYLDYGAALSSTSVKANAAASSSARLGASLKGTGKLAGGAGGLAFVMSDLDNKLGLSNTAMGAMAGALAGPWGAAIGGAIGAAMDFAQVNSDVHASIKQINQAIASAGTNNLQEQLDSVNLAYAKVERLSKRGGISSLKDSLKGAFGQSDTEQALAAADRASAAYLRNKEAAAQLAFEEAGLASSMRNSSQSVREQTSALLDNINAQNARANEMLGQLDAEIRYEAAIDATTEAIKRNGKNTDITTQGGQANVQALSQQAAAWNSLDLAGQKARGGLGKARASFIANATAMGYSSKKAAELADKYLAIPTDIATKFKTPGADGAIAKAVEVARKYKMTPDEVRTALKALDYSSKDIKRVQALMKQTDGRRATVRVNADTSAAMAGINGVRAAAAAGVTMAIRSQKANAEGGVVDYFANGGLRERHVAQIAPAGAYRVWAEPETGGEAYIPLSYAKRRRSIDIWAETGRRLGIPGFADGAIRSAAPVPPAARSDASVIGLSLVGAKANLVGPGLIEFVDGRIEAANSSDRNFQARRARAGVR